MENQINAIEGFNFNGLDLLVSYDIGEKRKTTVKIGDEVMELKDFQEFLMRSYEFCPDLFLNIFNKDN